MPDFYTTHLGFTPGIARPPTGGPSA